MTSISFLECNRGCYLIRCNLGTISHGHQWSGWKDPSKADTDISKECQVSCNDECRKREIPPTATEKECFNACFCKHCSQTTDESICSSVQGAANIFNQLRLVYGYTYANRSCMSGCETDCRLCFKGRTDGETHVQCDVDAWFSTGPAPLPDY